MSAQQPNAAEFSLAGVPPEKQDQVIEDYIRLMEEKRAAQRRLSDCEHLSDNVLLYGSVAICGIGCMLIGLGFWQGLALWLPFWR